MKQRERFELFVNEKEVVGFTVIIIIIAAGRWVYNWLAAIF